MAWTTARTWVDGEVPTAAQFNAEFRDNYNLTMPGLVTTKGDTVVSTGANATARLAVGSNDEIYLGDSTAAGGWKWGAAPIPVGMLGFFASACPTGWTEYTASRGRAIVGVPSGGTGEGTVGSVMTNQQDKTHTHTGDSHTHARGNLTNTNNGLSFGTISPSNVGTSTDPTSTSALSDMFAYIQLRVCQKD